jgi:hypothetical protein
MVTASMDRRPRERGASSWLGHPAAQGDLFARYRDLDRWRLSFLSTATGGLTPASGLGAAMGPCAWCPPGEDAGIVNPPGGGPTSHRLRRWLAGEHHMTPDEWLQATSAAEGSWWLAWFEWLRQHSSGTRRAPAMGAPSAGLPPLGPAPGTYALQR